MLEQFRRSFISSSTFAQRAYRAFERLDAKSIVMRNGVGTKTLIEEVLPIAAFLKHLEIPSRHVRCQLARRGADHDAVIQLAGPEVEQGFWEPSYFIEVTSAVSGTDYLEREALIRNGGVFGGGKIRRVGCKARGNDKIISEAVAVDAGEAVVNVAKWIAERIRAKCAKMYPQPCILLVDSQPERRLTMHEWAEVAAVAGQAADKKRFRAVFIVQWERNFVFEV